MTINQQPEQPLLFSELIEITPDPDETIEERFERFNAENSHVFWAIVELARGAKQRGMKRWSINGIFEVLRWIRAASTQGDPWVLNNDYRALYARKVMRLCPDLDGFFEVRQRQGEEASDE